MDFVKREQHNLVDDENYKAYAEAIQKSQHQLESSQDYQHTAITMEQLHQAMQSTFSASSLMHNFQIPLSPRQMSTLMLKTNHLGRNMNFSDLPQHLARNLDMDSTQNLINDLGIPLGRNTHDDMSITQNLQHSANRELQMQQNIGNLGQQELNQDLRNSLQIIQNLGRNIADVLPQNLGRNETDLAQEISRSLNHELDLSHHLSRTQMDVNQLSITQDDPRRTPLVVPSLPQSAQNIIDQRLTAQSLSGHDRDNNMLPLPFQIKSEQDEDGNFYEVNTVFVNNVNGLHGHIPVEHDNSSNLQQETQMYNYYNNHISNLNQPTLASIDLYARQQSFINNYSPQNNPQNLVVPRQFDGLDNYLSDDLKRHKIEGKAVEDSVKINEEPKENLKLNNSQKDFYQQYNESVEQAFSEKNENDSSAHNKIPISSSDDVAYKNLIEAEYANIKGEYACYKCNEVFPSKRGLKLHSKNCTENGENTLDCTEKIGKFSCPQCPYKCQSPAILKIHERTHTGEKPFSCKFCDYKSGQKNNVAKHILVHMREKPFRCQYCDYRCAQKNNLVVHERTHTGYKPFACTYCDYRTVQKPNLVKHMYLHTDQKPFSCDLCTYRCVQKTNLTKHKQRHLNEKSGEKLEVCSKIPNKPYRPRQKSVKCQFCSYKCVQKSSLDKHMQFKHADLSVADQVNANEDFIQENCYVGGEGLNLMKNISDGGDEIQNLSVRRDDMGLSQDECQEKLEPLQIQS